MTLANKLRALWTATKDVGGHAVAAGVRWHVWPVVIVLGLAGGALYLAEREFRSAMAFSLDAGRPVKLKPSKIEQSGDAIRTQYVDRCPAWQIEAATKKGRDQFAQLGIDPRKVSVLATYDIPRGPTPYGAVGATTINKATGEVENTMKAANPWLAGENRFAFGSGVVYSPQGIGATLHGDWEPFSVRGPRGYRFFLRVGADVDILSGSAKPRATALLVLRRP